MKCIAGRKKRVVEREERVEMEILDEGEYRIMMLIYFQHLIILFILFLLFLFILHLQEILYLFIFLIFLAGQVRSALNAIATLNNSIKIIDRL